MRAMRGYGELDCMGNLSMKFLTFIKDLLVLVFFVVATLLACFGCGDVSGAIQIIADKYNDIKNKYFK